MALFGFSGYVTDDAGNRVKLLDKAGMSEWPSKGDERITDLVTRLRRVISQASSAASLATFLFAITIWFGYGMLVPMINSVLPRVPGYVHLGVIIVLIRLVIGLMWRLGLSLRRNQIANLILTEGLCPSCGYNFAGLRLENREAGVMVNCPECGAAWRASRIVRVEPFDASLPLSLPTSLVRKRIKMPKWSIPDDRGVPVKLVYPSLRDQFWSQRDPAVVVRVRRARQVIRKSGRWIRVPLSIVMGLLGAYFAVRAVMESGTDLAGLHVVGACVCIGTGAAMYFGNFMYKAWHVRTAMLDEGLCAGCGRDLRSGLVPHVDGCVECACHAAWRISPPTEAP